MTSKQKKKKQAARPRLSLKWRHNQRKKASPDRAHFYLQKSEPGVETRAHGNKQDDDKPFGSY